MTTVVRASFLAIAIVAAMGLLSGCRVGPRSDFHAFTSGSGVIRCASAQSAVGEPEDQTSGGGYPAASVTAANRDLYCANEDTVAPAWSSIRAETKLIYYVNSGQVAICRVGPTVTEVNAGHQAISVVDGRCGSNRRYYAAGSHRAVTAGGQDHYETTFSPEITLP